MRHPFSIVMAFFICQEAGAQAPTDRAQYVHDRVVEYIKQSANRPIAVGDTFVGWWPNPVLYNTVRRTADTVESSLVRLDTTVGTAVAVWKNGRQVQVNVTWTHGDSTSLRLQVTASDGVVTFRGTVDTSFSVPSIPWAIADYGMDDQLVPLILGLSSGVSRQVTVFRPFPRKWGVMTVSVRRTNDAIFADLVNGPGDTDHWIITLDGALVRVTRDKYPNLERRPLEQTSRMADYVRLRDKGKGGS
ncbi:MAG: hypothetical protein DMD33_12700 [Gemmatimonadetes bacterium]|nr:MAG: hypothetical protein DMD33_12700 [Gemmatimonadota bacterium]